MIYQIYTAFFFITLILLILGYYSKNDILKIVGYGLIFTMGIMVFQPLFYGNVEYCENIYGVINGTLQSQEVCHEVQNRIIGLWIAILGALGFMSVFYDMKNQKEEEY